MRIINPLQMNDWPIKKFLISILSFQFFFSGVVVDILGLSIPFLREIVSFIFLIFVPGMVILRILRLHNLGNIETFLYSIGLSISYLIFLGLFIDVLYPVFGFSRPLSTISLLISVNFSLIFLIVLSYIIDRNFSNQQYLSLTNCLSSPFLFIVQIPLLTVIGTYLVNSYGINTAVLLSLFADLFVIFLVILDYIPKSLYPLSIFAITLSILYHTSLISNYLWGYDIHYEFFTAHSVITNSFWNPHIFSDLNSLLSVVILTPVFSNLCNINLIWVFKIIYPLIFSLIPVGLYRIFQIQMDEKISFLACFYFISFNPFFTELVVLPRQQIAELFLVLITLTLINNKSSNSAKSFLVIIFSCSLIVSHYGLSYIYTMILIISWLFLFIVNKINIKHLINKYPYFFASSESKITFNYMILFIVMTLAWYIYISDSSSFTNIVKIANHIMNAVFNDFLDPKSAQGLALMTSHTYTTLQTIHKYINYLNQIFIIIGVFMVLTCKNLKINKTFFILSIGNLFVLFTGTTVPHFASSFNMTRLYHITLFFLAPFCIIGGIIFLRFIFKKIDSSIWTDNRSSCLLIMIAIYFALFFSFQTGLLSQVVTGNSDSLSIGHVPDYPCFTEQEVLSTNWLTKVKNNPIYSDSYRSLLLTELNGNGVNKLLNNTSIPQNSYVYFGRVNTLENKVLLEHNTGVTRNMIYMDSKSLVGNSSLIYESGCTSIYY